MNFSNGQHLGENQGHSTAFFQAAFPGKSWNQRKLGKACVRGAGLSL